MLYTIFYAQQKNVPCHAGEDSYAAVNYFLQDMVDSLKINWGRRRVLLTDT